MILGKYQVTILARNQPVSFEWCHLLLLPGPFWYLVSKSFHDLLVIIHIQRLWRCITMKICKIHWKLMIFKSQYCFANISATKAPIFMKFETYIHKIVKNYQKIFRKDPCTHARTRGKNVRARVLSRRNVRAHVYASCSRICARIFTKNLLLILYYLVNISLKFHKDRSFRCGDICNTILSFKNHQFSMYFAYFHSFALPKSSKMNIFWRLMEFFGK